MLLVRMQLSLPRDARYVSLMRNVTDCVLADLNVPGEARSDMQVAVSEACTNAVKHATSVREYDVALGIAPDRCEVEIIDRGPGFDAPESDGEVDVSQLDMDLESGRGLMLIRALVDDFELQRDGEVTRVRLTKRWPAGLLEAQR